MGNAGGIVVYGRSDTTLKPGGVRIGTAEVYRFAEEVPAVEDSLVIGDQIKVGKRAGDVRIVLFVKLTPVRRRAPPRSPTAPPRRRPTPPLPSPTAAATRTPKHRAHASALPRPQGTELTKELEEEIRAQIRNGASDAHVPALIKEVQKIPYTRSGKKVELAVRALFEGQEPKNVGALQDDTAFDEYRKMAADGF